MELKKRNCKKELIKIELQEKGLKSRKKELQEMQVKRSRVESDGQRPAQWASDNRQWSTDKDSLEDLHFYTIKS